MYLFVTHYTSRGRQVRVTTVGVIMVVEFSEKSRLKDSCVSNGIVKIDMEHPKTRYAHYPDLNHGPQSLRIKTLSSIHQLAVEGRSSLNS